MTPREQDERAAREYAQAQYPLPLNYFTVVAPEIENGHSEARRHFLAGCAHRDAQIKVAMEALELLERWPSGYGAQTKCRACGARSEGFENGGPPTHTFVSYTSDCPIREALKKLRGEG